MPTEVVGTTDVQDDDAMEVEAEEAPQDDEEEESLEAVEVMQDDNEEEDEEEEGGDTVAAVVVDNQEAHPAADDEEVEAAVVVEAEPTKNPSTPTKMTKKKKPSSSSKGTASPTKKKVVKKKKKKTTKSTGSAKDGSAQHAPVSPRSLQAAKDARSVLEENVQTLPLVLMESQVRSFGRIPLDGSDKQEGNKFVSPSAIYPVGFSSDRFEFSPVHGRPLKIRCCILDGRRIKEKQKAGGFPISDVHDGPVFRLMWGRGVDEDDDDDVEYPFHPDTHAAPQEVPAKKGKASSSTPILSNTDPPHPSMTPQIHPEVGMRVRVRFDKNKYYFGTIVSAMEAPPASNGSGKKKKQKKPLPIEIQYDDGSKEEIPYPDPDVAILLPGAEDDIDSNGNPELTQLKGKPVTSVVGTSPIETWGRTLIQLGLIDEIIFDAAMEALEKSRQAVFQEAKDKLLGNTPKTPRQRSDSGGESMASSPAATPSNNEEGEMNGLTAETEAATVSDREEPSEEEKRLREKAESLKAELALAMQDDHEASIELADARINLQGPFLCNPFSSDDQDRTQQTSWLVTAVRKEKTKMGSTGNRKKIVTAFDLLERNNTIYNAEIDGLLEGLPGSEYCRPYVFQAFRPGATSQNRAWVHEVQLRREKEAIKRDKEERKRLKRSKEAMEKEKILREKKKKRKQREEVRESRKRQKVEEEEQKKRARIEERLSRLRVQVEERLYSEATFQREKAVAALARSLNREFNRRRKAAELVAAQAIVEATMAKTGDSTAVVNLPPLAKPYDEETLRVWNFVTTFGSFFVERGYLAEVPSLDSLQSAIDSIRSPPARDLASLTAADSVSSLTDLAVALCKPLAASLTRILFSSLIALNPILQKDFGAAFFKDVNSTSGSKEESDQSSSEDLLLPVNSMTWQDIARSSLLADALGELGSARHEAAHTLRGYRSAGHPNSKEARRLRKAEDYWVALLRQEVHNANADVESGEIDRIQTDTPCVPLCTTADFRFFLHSVKSIPDLSLDEFKERIDQAMKSLDSSPAPEAVHWKEDLDKILKLVLEAKAHSDSKAVQKLRTASLVLYEKYAGVASKDFAAAAARGEKSSEWPWEDSSRGTREEPECIPSASVTRLRMGALESLETSKATLKSLGHVRETYMEEALRLKEEEKRREAKGDEDEDDDDDDDEDDEDGDNGSNIAAIVDGDDGTKEDASGQPKNGPQKDAPGSVGDEKPDAVTDTIDPAANEKDSGQKGPLPIGKPTGVDDVCGDIPTAPELIRRCLAVLRVLCTSTQSSAFLNPVDPQSNPGYYDAVLRPMCLREAGMRLRKVAEEVRDLPPDEKVRVSEKAVAEFGRNIRLIEQNTLCYANAGPTVISMGAELRRIFERLFFDWVLAPDYALPSLEDLDDDRCVEPHPSDEESTVLFCDGCEGKYNIGRLDPPLKEVPQGDWYCPRCTSGRWWGQLDPRIGKKVKKTIHSEEGTVELPGTVKSCSFQFPEGSMPSLMYSVEISGGVDETWTLEAVDKALDLAKTPVPPVRCLEAVAESPGYSAGVDAGLQKDLIPITLNPHISEAAAQVSLSSSVFRDTITTSGALLVLDPEDMSAGEWLRLLALLVMKCSSSEVIQQVVSEMENKAAESMAKPLEQASKVVDIQEVLPDLPFDTEDEEDSALSPDVDVEMEEVPSVELIIENDNKTSASESIIVKPEPTVKAEAVTNGNHKDTPGVSTPGKPQEKTDTALPSGGESKSETPQVQAIEVPVEAVPAFSLALAEKKTRRKAVEDSITAFCAKGQLRPIAASFEEDTISRISECSESAKKARLDFASMRCRRTTCSFCGLTDMGLGEPLLRVPNDQEWRERIPHAARSRRFQLVADLSSEETDDENNENDKVPPKLAAVTIRIDGDIFSVRDSDLGDVADGGMTEFLARSDEGFQSDLQFYYDSQLPFTTGSLSAHESCAVAAHNARRDLMVQHYKDRQAELIENEAGRQCGRTLEIGRDCSGRAYWKFSGDESALFVCEETDAATPASWQRYADSNSIASVMVALQKDPVVKELQRAYPDATKAMKSGSWADALLKRRFPRVASLIRDDDTSSDMDIEETEASTSLVAGGFDPYVVGEDVLVESLNGSYLWDGLITAISTRTMNGQSKSDSQGRPQRIIDAYRVEYKGWSSRYIEWVEPRRVVEPNENNKLLQAELQEERASSCCGLPTSLNFLAAKDFLQARDRVRGKNTPLPDFARIVRVDGRASSRAKTLVAAKAAILAVEAALPIGSVNNLPNGVWRPENAQQWRVEVEKARGPARLMQCVILLEDVIEEDWIKEDVGHLRACLPARWKAIPEASASALAIRITLFDRSIRYEKVDRSRFRSRQKKKGKSEKDSKSGRKTK